MRRRRNDRAAITFRWQGDPRLLCQRPRRCEQACLPRRQHRHQRTPEWYGSGVGHRTMCSPSRHGTAHLAHSPIAISPDGKRAVSGGIDGGLKLWNLETGKLVRAWLGHGLELTERCTRPTASSSSPESATTRSRFETGRRRKRYGNSGDISGWSTRSSSDGKRLAAPPWTGQRGYGASKRTGNLAVLATGSLYSIAFGPGGTLITGGNGPENPDMACRQRQGGREDPRRDGLKPEAG